MTILPFPKGDEMKDNSLHLLKTKGEEFHVKCKCGVPFNFRKSQLSQVDDYTLRLHVPVNCIVCGNVKQVVISPDPIRLNRSVVDVFINSMPVLHEAISAKSLWGVSFILWVVILLVGGCEKNTAFNPSASDHPVFYLSTSDYNSLDQDTKEMVKEKRSELINSTFQTKANDFFFNWLKLIFITLPVVHFVLYFIWRFTRRIRGT